MEKRCPVCQERILGRKDKKFCSDQCRVTHYNNLNSDTSKFMRNVTNILKKNRRILESLNPNDKAKVSKTELLDEGFKFNYFTNEYKTKAGNVYKFCYDQGYLDLGDGMYAIVKKKEYVD